MKTYKILSNKGYELKGCYVKEQFEPSRSDSKVECKAEAKVISIGQKNFMNDKELCEKIINLSKD